MVWYNILLCCIKGDSFAKEIGEDGLDRFKDLARLCSTVELGDWDAVVEDEYDNIDNDSSIDMEGISFKGIWVAW